MSDEQHYGSPRFGGDMDRNEVEIDLNKFMALLQEKSELKDRIRELEDEKNDNPYQKCVPKSKAKRMTKKQKASAVKRKRAVSNKGPKPKNVKTMKNGGFIAKGCGKVMPNRRKLTKIY